ncbi:MAG: DUF2799 domain-containing protein [Pseudomonadota bacterium]
MIRRALGIAICGLGVLVSCATLTDEECKAGNWFDIGFDDGANGRLPGFVAAHTDACADLGILPDRAVWEDGRQAGLRRYCTPQTVYDLGRKGRALSPVCPVSQLPALELASARGQEYHRLTDRILDLEDDLRAIRDELRSLDDQSALLATSLRSEAQFIRLRILSLQADRRRVATPT